MKREADLFGGNEERIDHNFDSAGRQRRKGKKAAAMLGQRIALIAVAGKHGLVPVGEFGSRSVEDFVVHNGSSPLIKVMAVPRSLAAVLDPKTRSAL